MVIYFKIQFLNLNFIINFIFSSDLLNIFLYHPSDMEGPLTPPLLVTNTAAVSNNPMLVATYNFMFGHRLRFDSFEVVTANHPCTSSSSISNRCLLLEKLAKQFISFFSRTLRKCVCSLWIYLCIPRAGYIRGESLYEIRAKDKKNFFLKYW